MTLNPDVVRKAQAQLEEVIGRDRAPAFDDAARLPYIQAIVKEVLRWRPAGPLGAQDHGDLTANFDPLADRLFR